MEQLNIKLGEVTMDNATQGTMSIIGGKGTGKTQTLKMLAASIDDEKTNVLVIDPLNIIHIKGFKRILVPKKSIGSGAALGKAFNKFKRGYRLILSFIDLLQEEEVTFIDGFLSEWKPTHTMLLVDEVHELAPETGTSGTPSEEYERFVRHCRNKDNGVIQDTQRPAQTRKNVLALSDHFILYRVTYTHDVKAVKELLGDALRPEQLNDVVKSIQTMPFLNGYEIVFR